MTKQFIGQNSGRPNVGTPNQGVARYDGNLPQASSGKYVPQLQPINFSPINNYMEEMNAVANLGAGIANAAVKIKVASDEAAKTSRDAYLASIESDDIVQTNRIYNENMLSGNDPEALATKLGEYRDGKKSEMPTDIQPYYEASFNKRAAVLTVRSQDQFFQKVQSDNKSSLESTQKLIREDIFKNPLPKTEIEVQEYQDKLTKFQATLQSRVNNGFITPEEATLEQKSFQKDVVTAGFKSQLDALPQDRRDKLIYELSRSKELPAGLSLESRNEIVSELSAYSVQLETVKTRAFAEEKAASDLKKARVVADFEIRLNRGEATYDEIVKLEQQKLITPDKKASFFKTLDTANKEKLTELESISKLKNVLDGSDYFDPKNSSDKKAVDLGFEKSVKPLIEQSQDPAYQKSLITDYVSKTGIVPSALQGKIRGVMRGGTVQDKVYYADLVGRIQESKPQALDDFDDKDVAQAVMIDQLVKAGTPNDVAVEKVDAITNNMTPGRLEFLKQEFNERQKSTAKDAVTRNAAVVTHVADLFDSSVFSRNASLPDRQLGVESAAVSDYNKLYETWYLNTNGDDKLAREQADRAFQRVWGTTAINGQGKQLTKYPIEQAYPYLKPEEIRTSLLSDLKSHAKYKDVSDSDVFLQYDTVTAREWGSKNNYPSYRIFVRNKQGVIEPLPEPELNRWAPITLADKKKQVRSTEIDFRKNKFGK